MDNTLSLPLLPVSTFVCQPGNPVDFRLPNTGYYIRLLDYMKAHNETRLAIAYLTDPNGDEYDLVSKTVTVINVDSCREIKKNGHVLAWQIHSENGFKAEIQDPKDQLNLEHIGNPIKVRFAKVVPKREKLWDGNMESSTYLILIPLWTELRSLGTRYDCQESALPSLGNRYFYGYTFAPEKFLTTLYTTLPLNYQQKLRYLEANDLQTKSIVMLGAIDALKKENYRQKIEKLTLSNLVRVSPYAIPRNN